MQTLPCIENLPAVVDSSGLFTKEQSQDLASLRKEIAEAWDNQVVWRTFTEANYSVLNDIKFPTPASKYHQATREQLVFYEQTILLSFDYREKQIDLAETLEKLEGSEGYEKQRLEVKRDRLLFEIEGMKIQAKDRIRELKMWSEIKSGLDDGSFDTKNKDTDELIHLTVRYCREASLIKGKTNDIGAITNIVGQATTCLMECKRRGITGQLPPECHKVLRQIGGRA
ncbi:MAG: hypothetical protein QM438_02645 [Euryarchaeota archaeon]|nr:hypothetical protein [Euryarchaeota archaeon]